MKIQILGGGMKNPDKFFKIETTLPEMKRQKAILFFWQQRCLYIIFTNIWGI